MSRQTPETNKSDTMLATYFLLMTLPFEGLQARVGIINDPDLVVITPLGKLHLRPLLSGPLFLQLNNGCPLMTRQFLLVIFRHH